MKARLKALQKDLAAERTELAELKKYDPQRLRKNLDASKRKLADKTNAADKLQKTLTQARAENAQLEQKIKELEAQLVEAKPKPDHKTGQEPLKLSACIDSQNRRQCLGRNWRSASGPSTRLASSE